MTTGGQARIQHHFAGHRIKGGACLRHPASAQQGAQIVDPRRVVAENASDVVLALARLLCEAYGEHLGWRSTASDAHELRRWTCRSDGPEYPGHPYAMDDGSSAGENERAAWIAAARALFDSERT